MDFDLVRNINEFSWILKFSIYCPKNFFFTGIFFPHQFYCEKLFLIHENELLFAAFLYFIYFSKFEHTLIFHIMWLKPEVNRTNVLIYVFHLFQFKAISIMTLNLFLNTTSIRTWPIIDLLHGHILSHFVFFLRFEVVFFSVLLWLTSFLPLFVLNALIAFLLTIGPISQLIFELTLKIMRLDPVFNDLLPFTLELH